MGRARHGVHVLFGLACSVCVCALKQILKIKFTRWLLQGKPPLIPKVGQPPAKAQPKEHGRPFQGSPQIGAAIVPL